MYYLATTIRVLSYNSGTKIPKHTSSHSNKIIKFNHKPQKLEQGVENAARLRPATLRFATRGHFLNYI